MSQNANNKDDGGFGNGFGASTFGGGDLNGGGGEFGSNHFGGTNAVSQIFKDAGGGDEERKRRVIIYSALALGLAGIGWAFFHFSADPGTDASTPQVSQVAPPPADAAPAVPESSTDVGDDEVTEEAAAPAAVVPPVAAPSVGGEAEVVVYNEEKGGVTVAARDGAVVEVARSRSFADTYVRGVAKGGAFRIPNPPPGQVFWREQGSAQAKAIQVKPAPGLALHLDAPGTLSAGSSVSWSSAGNAAFYRLDFASDASFDSIVASFSTTQQSLSPKSLQPGKWFVRLGAYNKASGKWEWTPATNVTVQ